MLALNGFFCSMAFKPWGFESLTALCYGWGRPIGTVCHWPILFWKLLYFQIESSKTQHKSSALKPWSYNGIAYFLIFTLIYPIISTSRGQFLH